MYFRISRRFYNLNTNCQIHTHLISIHVLPTTTTYIHTSEGKCSIYLRVTQYIYSWWLLWGSRGSWIALPKCIPLPCNLCKAKQRGWDGEEMRFCWVIVATILLNSTSTIHQSNFVKKTKLALANPTCQILLKTPYINLSFYPIELEISILSKV